MHGLSAAELLGLWERGVAEPPLARALVLAAASDPGIAPGDLEHATIGQRDALLLDLRERTFGSRLECVSNCPECGESAELVFHVADIRTGAPEPRPHTLCIGSLDITYRLPDTEDLAAASVATGLADARQILIERCVTAESGGEPVPSETLANEVVAAVAAHMAEGDPQADVRLALACPACTHEWEVGFDIASFFWSEVQKAGSRLLREVDALARAYGWSEADILNMSAWRRQMYLELVAS